MPTTTQQSPGISQCHCGALRRAARRMSQFYDGKLAPTGLRSTQYSILALLHHVGEVPINELARRMDLDRTTAGKNLRPLERDGLIAIAPSATDARSRVIALTAKGTAQLMTAVPLWREAQQQFEKSNGLDTVATLRGTLAKLRIGA